MTNPEEEPVDNLEEMTQEEAEVFASLQIQPSDRPDHVRINLRSFKDALDRFRNKTAETIFIENDMYGFRIALSSQKFSAKELLGFANKNFQDTLKKKQVRIPLGVY